MIKKSDYAYELPEELIADVPIEAEEGKFRDDARLLVLNRETGNITHAYFKDLYKFLEPGDVVVVNNVKVFPARLYGIKERTNANIEILLLRELDPELHLWDTIVSPARKVRVGNKIVFHIPTKVIKKLQKGAPHLLQGIKNDVLVAEVIDNTTSRGRTVRFHYNGTSENLRDLLREVGYMPIPPYMKRKPDDRDRIWYQTIFAKDEEEYGIAAHTSALHFTETLCKRLFLNDIDLVEITLHIGVASFNPINVEDLKKFQLDAEFFRITPEAAKVINRALAQGKRVVAVGTSVVRALESSVSADGFVLPTEGWTNLFIYPGFKFRIVKAMVTNFHQPESTNIIMTATFAGKDLLFKAYEEAINQRYRFLSYGDAMLIL